MNWPLLIFLVLFFAIVVIMAIVREEKSEKSSFTVYGEFCEICRKWCGKSFEWTYATHEGKSVKVCHDCRRAIELKK